MIEKHNVHIRRATTKYKHTHMVSVEASNKDLEKLLFKPMEAQELQKPKKAGPLDKKYPEEAVLLEDGLYRYLYRPGEQHGEQKR